MIQIDTKAYIFQMFVSLCLFYITFCLIDKSNVFKRKIMIGLFTLPIFFLLDIFMGSFVYVIYIPVLYLMMNKSENTKYLLLNSLLSSNIFLAISNFISSFIILNFVNHENIQGFNSVLCTLGIQIGILLILIKAYRKGMKLYISNHDNNILSCILLGILDVTILLYASAAHFFKVFDKFISGTILFVFIQLLVMIGMFFWGNTQLKKMYSLKLVRHQLEDLEKYTKQLELSQHKLRKFKHDYKNILLALKELQKQGNIGSIGEYLTSLEEYSANELKNTTLPYNDIEMIKNIYLKSLLLNKFFQWENQSISYTFECKKTMSDMPIEIFDLIRMLGIFLDNSFEEVKKLEDGEIIVLICEEENDLEIIIENTCSQITSTYKEMSKAGYTSKENHSGLGLSIVQDIQMKYSNVLIQHQRINNIFSINICITKESRLV